MNEILDRIEKELKKNNKKQMDLCSYVGISNSTFSTWKKRGTSPAAEYIPNIAEFLGVSERYLLTGKSDVNSNLSLDLTLVDRIRELANRRNMSLPQLETTLGFGNGTISRWKKSSPSADKLKAVADYFNVSVDFLLDGSTQLTPKDERDIARRLEETLSELEAGQDGLMFSGEPLDDETRELLKISLENSIRLAKVTAKEKFTPKKYKK